MTVFLAFFAFAAAALSAQQADTAIVLGTVADSSGGALPGTTVTLTHLATNTAVNVTTDQRGQYRTSPLRPGDYEVAAQLDGFRRFSQRGVTLNIGDVRSVDVTLEIGSVAETVTVEAAPPPLNTSDSTVGTVITNKQIAALPLNGRDYLQLASLSPGTGPATSQGVVIGGQSGTAVAFLLDGHDNNSQQISIPIRPTRESSSRARRAATAPPARWSESMQGHWSNTIGNHNNFTRPQGGDDGAPGAGSREGNQANRAPSRVSDPTDGQVPYQPWARARQQEFAAHLEDPTRPEYVEPLARCAPAGPTKSFMWHGYEIRQYPGYVRTTSRSGLKWS